MPKYYVKDFSKDKYIAFESKEELAQWWIRNNGLNYDDLNMNGNDTRIIRFFDYAYMLIRTEICLRRYMVIEANTNRIIDIRDWHIENMQFPKYKSHWWPYNNGHKSHCHRKGSAPMMRRTMRSEMAVQDIDDTIYGNVVKRLKAKPSHFCKTNPWDYPEMAHYRDWASSKCWKDQCKSPKQYWKHKKGFGKIPKPEDDADNIDDDFDASFESNLDVA